MCIHYKKDWGIKTAVKHTHIKLMSIPFQEDNQNHQAPWTTDDSGRSEGLVLLKT